MATSLQSRPATQFAGLFTTGDLRSTGRLINDFSTFNLVQLQGKGQTKDWGQVNWATENTREALFAAMKRKEVYATTGPRMIVRFFGGWNYQQEDCLKPDLARVGYARRTYGGRFDSRPRRYRTIIFNPSGKRS